MIGSTFDYDNGPDLKGYWKNYRTGQTVYIKDTIIENGQLTGIDRSGRMVPYNVLSQFVKCSKEEAEAGTPMKIAAPARTGVTSTVNEHLDDNIYNEIDLDNENFDLTAGSSNTNNSTANYDAVQRQTPGPAVITETSVTSIDPAVIKVLDGITETPKITVKVQWDNFPEGLVFLNKYLKTDIKDITDAVLYRWADTDALREKICTELVKIIRENLSPTKPKEEKKPAAKDSAAATKKNKKELN